MNRAIIPYLAEGLRSIVARVARYTQTVLEAYEQRSREAIQLFPSYRISFQECSAVLDDALGALITKVAGKELVAVTALAMKNNEAVMKEMERCTSKPRLHRVDYTGRSGVKV